MSRNRSHKVIKWLALWQGGITGDTAFMCWLIINHHQSIIYESRKFNENTIFNSCWSRYPQFVYS
ncbi:hypothetical protein LDI01_11190 [Lentilactobacillus diolivorans]|uniref:Uncharacterized protein n=1 Tax=Lentilactobacillus diolivorans TaxID=179838 RepID=A0ABQ0XBQ6_9LACO|nr:hypothetical protein LDI01_11190 [Lentilactobacillus diolivorans]